MQKPVQWLLVKFIHLVQLSERRNPKQEDILTEFWMVEPEVAFNDLNDNMDLG